MYLGYEYKPRQVTNKKLRFDSWKINVISRRKHQSVGPTAFVKEKDQWNICVQFPLFGESLNFHSYLNFTTSTHARQIFCRHCFEYAIEIPWSLRGQNTRQVSSMIQSTRPTVSPVANIVFSCFVLLDFEKWGRTDGCTDVRHVKKQLFLPDVTVGRPSGSIKFNFNKE